jgi:hypothetical protein
MEGLPKQVQEARAAADAIMARFKPGDTSPPPQEQQQAAQETKDTAVQQNAAPEVPKLPDASEETWEQRFNAINGKYNAEVPRLAEQIRELKGRLQQAEQALHEKAQQAPPQTDPPTSVSRDALNEYDEEFGKMYDLVQAQQAKIDALQSVLDQVQGNVTQVHQAQQMSEDQRFWRDLLNAVPDFDQLNGDKEAGIKADPRFSEWLEGIDGFSKMRRRDIGEKLMRDRNVANIKDFFDTFKASRKSKQPPPSPNQMHTEPASTSTNVDTMQPQFQQQQGETFSKADVDELYRLRRVGSYPFVWRGQVYKSDADTKPICQELIRAGIEGRIR